MFHITPYPRYAKLLLRFTHENPKGQKYLIGGIEKTVESFEATLLPKVRMMKAKRFSSYCPIKY